MNRGGSTFCCRPLDYHTAETGELVNGGRSPFISTVDMGARLCYVITKQGDQLFTVDRLWLSYSVDCFLKPILLLACKRRKLDGITYYSKQIPSELLACNVGVNLVLFAKYNGEESLSEICQHLEVGTSFNFALFKQLLPCQLYKTYELRALSTPYINNVGTKNHFFPYTETQFFEFDKYLFANWHRDWTIPTL